MLRRRFLLLCCLAGLLLITAPHVMADEPSGRLHLPAIGNNRTPPNVFGVQMYAPFNDSAQVTGDAPGAGVTWVRWPVAWSSIEPVNTTPSEYHFAALDATVREAARLHLNLIVTIGSNPSWAGTYPNGPIDRAPLAEFGEFMAALTERYDSDGWHDAPGSPRVHMWEFYNEPDFGNVVGAELGYGYWGDFGQAYAEMLCTAYAASKSASRGTQIAFGGIAHDWFEEDGGPFVRRFLDDVLRAGGGKCMDVMNFHYYPFFEDEWRAYGHGLVGKSNFMRSKLASYGLSHLPLIVTEAGHHSDDYYEWPSTPEEQANYVVMLFGQSKAAALDIMIWWTWIDIAGYWGETGLLTMLGERKLAYTAYKVASEKLGQARFVLEVPPSVMGSSDAQVYQFSTPGNLFVAWAQDAENTWIRLPGIRYRVIDPLGRIVREVSDASDGSVDGRVNINLGHEPKYLEQVQ